MKAEFRTSPPWEHGNIVPSEYTVVAEFPCVTWGWECDMYYWILRDSDGNRVLATTNHGSFLVCKEGPEWLKSQVKELSEFIECTKRALEQLPE